MFKKLFNLCNDGNKCETKRETKFFYGQNVKVVSGFYRGLYGKVEKEAAGMYLLESSILLWVHENELEAV